MQLEGRVAMITGGATRIGRAVTLGLAQAGADVLLHYNRSAGPAAETVAAARELGVDASALQADLADTAAASALVRAARERYGGVDVLVHGASPFVSGSLAAVTPATWRAVMAVLVDSFLALAQGLAPHMVERGEGAIVTLLDRGAFEPWPGFLAHSVGKSALWALTRGLAVELAPRVRVNGLVIGPVLPPSGYTVEQKERLAAGTLLGRWGDPRDVVDAVLFLVGADYVTGEALFVDGGQRWAHRRRAPGALGPAEPEK